METFYESIMPIVNNTMISLVIFAIVFDTIFGVGRAIREKKLNSCIGIDGALRKFGMVVAVTGFAILDKMVNFNLVPFLPKEALSFFGLERVGTCEFFCVLFICYEAVSILKNMYLCGLPVYGIWKHVRDFLGNYTDELPDDEEVKAVRKE